MSIASEQGGRQGTIATREAFTISRSLEYLSENELTKQLGYSRELWPLVLVKELIDNSVDNAEEIGVQPEVAVTISEDSSDWDRRRKGSHCRHAGRYQLAVGSSSSPSLFSFGGRSP